MFKIIKMFIYGLMILDVAVLPYGCGSSSSNKNRNKNQLYVTYECTNTDETINMYIDRSNYLDFSEEKTLTMEILKTEIDRYINENDAELKKEDNRRLNIKITSYEIEKVVIANTDIEITIPYTFEKGDETIYYEGIRGAYIVTVYLKVEYQIQDIQNEK